MTVIEMPAEERAWLELRKPYFNASAAGVLYDCHPFLSAADVAVEKLGTGIGSDTNDAMERGHRLEPVILDWLNDEVNAQFRKPDVMHVNGPLSATLDGLDPDRPAEYAEIKSTSHRWNEPPPHVRWQVVAQAAASGLSRCHVAWLDASMRFQRTVIEPTPDEVADVLDRAARFMAFIALGMTPEGVELRASHIAAMFPHPEHFVDLDDDGLQAVVLLHERRQARLAAEKAEDEAKDAVARLLLDCEEARYDGRSVVTWKASKPTDRTDWKSLAAAEPELVAKFTAQVPGARRMIVKAL